MEWVKFGLLFLYVAIRFLQFVVGGCLIIATKTGAKSKAAATVQKAIPITISLVINALVFMGMHYYHYGDFQIVGYIKNVWGLNIYYHDVEYFVVSAAIGIIVSVMAGMVLRIFLGEKDTWMQITKPQEYLFLSSGFFALALVMLGINAGNHFDSKIVISEICSNNKSYLLEEAGAAVDYIELYNTGGISCEIKELYLSDDKYNLEKLPLAGKVVPAEGYCVIPCIEGMNSFSINNKGEVIYLSDADGNIVEQITLFESEPDIAYIRSNNEISGHELAVCTPGIMNKTMSETMIEAPALSHESGFYNGEFELELSCNPDETIYYTLDGSVPDEGSYLYEEPIYVYDKSEEPNVWNAIPNIITVWWEENIDDTPVAKAFLVRAIAVDNMGNKSDIVTASYFVGQEEYKDKSVISLIASPDDLFGSEKGIYVTGEHYDTWYEGGMQGDAPKTNFRQEGRAWEREAVFELFDSTESVFQQNVGIRIQGASTRNSIDKRFSVYARKEYDGSEVLNTPLFDNEIKSYSVLLRPEFEDAFIQDLMEGRDIPRQRNQQVTLFLNGEYWYDGFLREKYSKPYFKNYYGIEEDNLILYKAGFVDEGVETDRVLYDEIYDFARTEDFSDDEIYDEFAEMIDIQSHIEFLCSNIYIANMDVDDTKNVLMWRSREKTDDSYSDGRWRWALYDMDALSWTSLNYYQIEEESQLNSFSQQPRFADMPYNQGTIYLALKQNDRFCKQFVLTFMDLLNENFSVSNVSEKLQEYGEDITWFNSFFEKRPVYMKQYLSEEFGLKGTLEKVILHNSDESMGEVRINTITPTMRDGSWSGEYYTDYPVTIIAIPKEGYEFLGWSGDITSTESEIEIPVNAGGNTQGMEISAAFRKCE